MLFLLVTTGMTFSVNADEQNNISLTEEKTSNTSEENKEDQTDNTLREVELIAYLHSDIYPFTLTLKQAFNSYRNTYVSPIKIYDNPPPEC